MGPPLSDDFDIVLEHFEDADEDTEELLDASLTIEADSWLAGRAASDPEYYEEERGEWPEDNEPSSEIIGHIDLATHEPFDEVVIALVPAEASWQVPCLLKFGGWNECPRPEEHSAVIRQWEQKYGARIITVSNDTIEMQVAKPPSSREEALDLAREQFVYCPDIVQQGTQTIEALAATLLNGTVWFFWWD
jgi:hypothetical protein